MKCIKCMLSTSSLVSANEVCTCKRLRKTAWQSGQSRSRGSERLSLILAPLVTRSALPRQRLRERMQVSKGAGERFCRTVIVRSIEGSNEIENIRERERAKERRWLSPHFLITCSRAASHQRTCISITDDGRHLRWDTLGSSISCPAGLPLPLVNRMKNQMLQLP